MFLNLNVGVLDLCRTFEAEYGVKAMVNSVKIRKATHRFLSYCPVYDQSGTLLDNITFNHCILNLCAATEVFDHHSHLQSSL